MEQELKAAQVRITELEKKLKKSEERLAELAVAGFSWNGFMVHGTKESVDEVLRLVTTNAR